MNIKPKISLLSAKTTAKRNIWRFTAFTAILIVFFILGLSFYVGWSLTHPKEQPVVSSPSDYSLPYKDISFVSADGKTKLEGWVIEPKTPPKMSIVFSHGYKKNRYHDTADFLGLSKNLVDAGFRVIMFDYRNSGNSNGEVTTVGVMEKYDLLGAVKWTEQHYKEPIGLYGGSMGAATALIAAGENKDIIGVVADSPFSDLESYLNENLSVWSHLPNIPFTPTILFLLPAVLGVDLAEASPIQAMAHISPRPVLFIHGDGDKKIPYTESIKMANTHKKSFDVWVPEDVDHVKAFHVYPEEYTSRIITFFEKALSNQTSGR